MREGPHYISYVRPRKRLVIHLPWEPKEQVESAAFVMRVIASRVTGWTTCPSCGVTLDQISKGVPHAPDCEWFRFFNLPEAKRWMEAAWAAHPERLSSAGRPDAQKRRRRS